MCSTCMNKSQFKNEQKWAALLVAIAFAWLAHVSAMPLSAADETAQPGAAAVEQSSRSDSDQAPGFVEREGPEWAPRTKVTTLLIIVGAVLIVFLIGKMVDAGS